jgi:hypothetical protein
MPRHHDGIILADTNPSSPADRNANGAASGSLAEKAPKISAIETSDQETHHCHERTRAAMGWSNAKMLPC